MNLNDYVLEETKRMIVYGDPFTGKTTLVAKLAEKFKLNWLDIENGAASIVRNVPKKFHGNINLVQIPDTKANPIAAETCLKVFDGGKCVICSTHGKVSCPLCAKIPEAKYSEIFLREQPRDTIFVLDSSTQLALSVMAHICRNKPVDYKPDWDDYAVQGRLLDKMFSQLQGGNFNAVIISHAQMVGTEKSDKITKLVPIGGTTNYNRTFAKYFDEVIYCELLNGKHKFTSKTGASPQVITGSKSNIDIESLPEASLLPFFS